MRQEKQKEIALIACIIIREDILKGTVFHTFDKAYELAIKFNEMFPEEKDWEYSYLDFDEAVIDFCDCHERYGYKRLKEIYKKS